MANGNGNVPVKKFHAGCMTATLWENERKINGKTVTIKSVSLARQYQDKDGNWKSTCNGFSALDAQKAILVLNKAFEFLVSSSSDEEAVVEEEVDMTPAAAGASAPCRAGEVQLAFEGVKIEA